MANTLSESPAQGSRAYCWMVAVALLTACSPNPDSSASGPSSSNPPVSDAPAMATPDDSPSVVADPNHPAAACTEIDITGLHAWADLERWYAANPSCVDGENAESISWWITRRLGRSWATLPDLDHLSQRTPGFRRLVTDLVGADCDEQDLARVLSNARDDCPGIHSALCGDIARVAAESIEQSSELRRRQRSN